MKRTTAFQTALSLMLAAVLLSISIAVPHARADAFPERELNILIVYDDSLEDSFAGCNITDLEDRFEQIAKLISIPYKETLNLTLNFSVIDYSTVFGEDEFSLECSDLYGPSTNPVWHHDAECSHGIDQYCTTQHHTSAMHIINIANPYALSTGNNYDVVAVYVGHKLCYYSHTNGHGFCGGMAKGYGYQQNAFSFVALGHNYLNSTSTDTCQADNFISSRGLFWHEFSHLLNLHHYGDSGIYCTGDCACMMRSSFDGVVYARNIWCPNCISRISDNLDGWIGIPEGGEQ